MTTFENGYAIVIGVDENQIERLKLPTVAKDVQGLYDVLVHPERCAYKPENVRLLKGEEATARNIVSTLLWLGEKVAADPDATAIIYYSGHGMVDTATDQYYLIPYDIQSLQRVRADAIKAETFNAEIAAMQPERLLVILDCCHAGGFDTKAVEVENPNLRAFSFPLELEETKSIPGFDPAAKDVHALDEGEGRAILNSSQGAQSSYIRNDGKMSLFTYHLIEALTGHAPHRPEDNTVLVTDVMGYVTREVAKTAREQNREQTPVMRTSGVFPVALVLGGEGLSKGVPAPDPLEQLPPASGTTFNQQGQKVGGHQANIRHMEGDIGQIGDTINTGGGAHFGGNINTGGGSFSGRDHIVHGDEVKGDKVGGDKIEGGSYSVGNVTSENFAMGPGASVSQANYGVSGAELQQLFASLHQQAEQSGGAVAAQKVQELQEEAARGEEANDERMASLIEDIADLAPAVVETLVGLFATGALAKVAGGATKYVLGRLKRRT